ncbi:MAG TPA: hypothetical protein VFG03_19910 [Telluria sp.]|nr:hypothetical protein [Telluria sp.]
MIGQWLAASFLFAAGAAVAAPLTTIRSCRADDGSRISLLAEPTIEGSRFYLQIDEQTTKAFTDMPEADFIGTIALAICADHVLVFAISYGPPYLKGVAVRKNPLSHAIERIDFAEKALPRWLYLNPSRMQLVIPNEGNEVPSKYLIYGLTAATAPKSEPGGGNSLPDTHGYKVLRLRK